MTRLEVVVAEARKQRDLFPVAVMIGLGLLVVLMAVGLVRGIASQGEYEADQRAESCESDYNYFLQIESYGHSARNSHLWTDFRADCGDLHEALTAYLGARDTARAADNKCEGLEATVGAVLLDLLESYGECDGQPLADRYEVADTPAVELAAPTQDPGSIADRAWPGEPAIGWSEAGEHAGTVQRVCGPLMSVRETDAGTFVNVGQDYPSVDRFTFVLWNVYLDSVGSGATTCGTGEIYLYDGVVAQMELQDPRALEIWR